MSADALECLLKRQFARLRKLLDDLKWEIEETENILNAYIDQHRRSMGFLKEDEKK